MNVAFISHCDIQDNSGLHICSVANAMSDLGLRCAVYVPNSPAAIDCVGLPKLAIVAYEERSAGRRAFPDGRGPDLIHAWTPRERVRKLTVELARAYGCPYIVHLEDNEEVILEQELDGLTYDELSRFPANHVDALVPEHRSHPVRYGRFLEEAAGITAVIDRLLEFKPPDLPGLVFWPGFDPAFLHLPASDGTLRRKCGIPDGDTVLAYNGNIHRTNAAEVRSLFLAVQALRRCGRGIKLLKTGRLHISQNWIQEAIESGAVIDLGFLPRSELCSVLAAADILVQPGQPDSFNDYRFPSKLPEFFASGKPVILPRTNVGLSVRDGVEAILLDHGNAIEIAQRIESLMDDPERAARIGAAGKSFAIRRLSWKTNAAPLKEFYGEILSRAARARQ